MIEIKFPQFPIHVPITKNKKAPNKYIKVNSQGIYNGAIARFGRSIAVKNLHSYFLHYIPNDLKINNVKKIKYIIKTVINHGDIRRINQNLVWKFPSEGYIPRWDIENLASIFIKTCNDSLVISQVIKDDSIQYVKNIEYEFQEVKNINQREIILQIYV